MSPLVKYAAGLALAAIAAPIPAQAPFAAPTIAGREDTTQLSTADQVAGVTDNSVGDNVTTGQVQFAGNAFQNMSGLSVLNVNTGNNVAINAAMNVNIAIVPRP